MQSGADGFLLSGVTVDNENWTKDRKAGPQALCLNLGTGIAAGITGYPNLLPATIAAVLILGMWAMDIAVWRSAMTSLRSRKLLLTLPWFSATYPLRRMWYRTKAKICKQKRYTWT